MGSLRRKTFTKPLPASAEIITRKGTRLAKWKDKAGKTRTTPITVGRNGIERITVTATGIISRQPLAAGITGRCLSGDHQRTRSSPRFSVPRGRAGQS